MGFLSFKKAKTLLKKINTFFIALINLYHKFKNNKGEQKLQDSIQEKESNYKGKFINEKKKDQNPEKKRY